MAQTKYTYSIATDTANAALASDALKSEYEASSIVTALDYITALGDVLDIYCKDALSAGDKTTLDGLVTAHTGVGLSGDPSEVNIIDPIMNKPFADADGFRARFKGISGTATKDTTTNIDYELTEDRYINGVRLMLKDHVDGDYVDFQIIDIDNILGLGANTVLDEFGSTWYMDSAIRTQPDVIVPYPAKILKDLYIRIKYTSVGTTNNVKVRANLYLHKKTV